jgi:ribosomal protein S18 acetylase RimI-like enzyme
VIRLARADDAAALLALWHEACSSPSVTDDVESVRGAIGRQGSAVLVAEDGDGRIIGSLIAAWDGWRGNMYRLAVLPDRRRERIATALVREGERRLEGAGARRLAAVVLDGEAAAAAFWASAGYVLQAEAGRFTKSFGG